MNKAIEKYCKKVSVRLCCSRKTKKSLVSELAKELQDYNEKSFDSVSSIIEEYGDINSIAYDLQDAVSSEEVIKTMRFNQIIGAVLLVFGIVSAISGVWYFMEHFHAAFNDLPTYAIVEIGEGEPVLTEVTDGSVRFE